MEVENEPIQQQLSKRRSSVGTAPPPKKQRQRASHGAGSSAGPSQHTEVVLANARAPPSALAPRRIDLESGAMLKIRLVNFKSHGHFTMEFGPRLNFIVGR